MPYDLRYESWIPWQRHDGSVEWGSPALLTDDIDGKNPIVGIAAPRPDFCGALLEFLIGLMTIAVLPTSHSNWRSCWKDPPSPRTLRKKIKACPDVFQLNGEYPRFLQDFDEFEAPPTGVADLLLDMPGDNTRKKNLDVFQHRANLTFGLPAAAMALITLQTYAPAGGPGYRTGIRGGGPLTTLVDPQDGFSLRPLWYKIWANVEPVENVPSESDIPLIFPWMTHSRCSINDRITTPDDAHRLQVYFSMPWRIRLLVEKESTRCDITGSNCNLIVRKFQKKNLGIKYGEGGWEHPLSPYYKGKNQDAWLPVLGRANGVGWHEFAAYIYGGKNFIYGKEGMSRPANTVAQFRRERLDCINGHSAQLHVFGYDQQNRKMRAWIEARMPFWHTDITNDDVLDSTAKSLTKTTYAAQNALRKAVYVASKRKNIRSLEVMLWAETEERFFSAIQKLAIAPSTCVSKIVDDFEARLFKITLNLFDRMCPFNHDSRQREQVVARNILRLGLRALKTTKTKPRAKVATRKRQSRGLDHKHETKS